MATNVCSGWDNSACKGMDHCPARCPRYIDDEEEAILIRPYREPAFDSLLEMYDAIETSTIALPRMTSTTARSGSVDSRPAAGT